MFKTLDQVYESVEFWMQKGENGFDWYNQAHSFCKSLSKSHGVSIRNVAGIVAALSPLKSWDLNKQLAVNLLNNPSTDLSIHTNLQLSKAVQIYNLKNASDIEIMNILKGRKTMSFYHNIMHPRTSEFVTVDTHMMNALKIDKWVELTPVRYDIIQNSVRKFAKLNKLPVPSVQANIWVNFKQNKG